jgi:hypothetical protein
MCSIFGSFSASTVNELRVRNAHRGALSNSRAQFNADGTLITLRRDVGAMEDVTDHSGFILCHQQAPTTAEKSTIHPSDYKGNLLWHNGIIKQHYLDKMIAVSPCLSKWDTHQLNIVLSDQGFSGLKPIVGSFACVWYSNGNLYMFRNAISPIFHKEATISSVPFDGSQSIEHNTVYRMDWQKKDWVVQETYDNVEVPFYFG